MGSEAIIGVSAFDASFFDLDGASRERHVSPSRPVTGRGLQESVHPGDDAGVCASRLDEGVDGPHTG